MLSEGRLGQDNVFTLRQGEMSAIPYSHALIPPNIQAMLICIRPARKIDHVPRPRDVRARRNGGQAARRQRETGPEASLGYVLFSLVIATEYSPTRLPACLQGT